jgi:hypothetical protein
MTTRACSGARARELFETAWRHPHTFDTTRHEWADLYGELGRFRLGPPQAGEERRCRKGTIWLLAREFYTR